METIIERLPEINYAMLETFAMIGVAIPLAVLLGTPLGIWLFNHAPGSHRTRPKGCTPWSPGLVNMVRSFPFLILLIAIIPFTRLVVGTSVGTAAAIVPLTINAIPYFARLVEQNITQLGPGAVEASRAMGSNPPPDHPQRAARRCQSSIHRLDHHHHRALSSPTRRWSAWWEVAASVTSPSGTATTATKPPP